MRFGAGISGVMMRVSRIYLALFLALVVTLTGHSVGALRGTSDVAEPMVLCTGGGAVTVYLDENGDPTLPPHKCPDCILHMLDAVTVAETRLRQRGCGSEISFVQNDLHIADARVSAAPARAPPVWI
ncbi:MAG: hypothetical protein ACU0AZ_08770 [Paracoccaceae bacterium]